jgi:D-glycero-alpha-D-manno-heptose 1-phosphate guanylyltransferase
VNSNFEKPAQSNDLLENIPALLLVGGLGTRLRSVLPCTPKPLARVGDAPFLRLLVRQLRSQGFRHLIMCSGHLGTQVQEELGDGHELDVEIEYSREPRPLGTAGAVKFAEGYLSGVSDFVVMNGDSFLELDFTRFLSFHRERGGIMSMAARKVANAARYGSVQSDAKNRVTGFVEKSENQGAGLINGGVYIFERAILRQIPDGSASLEKDVFPNLLQSGVYAFEQGGVFIDIGTPEDYARAQTLYQDLYQAAIPETSR